MRGRGGSSYASRMVAATVKKNETRQAKTPVRARGVLGGMLGTGDGQATQRTSAALVSPPGTVGRGSGLPLPGKGRAGAPRTVAQTPQTDPKRPKRPSFDDATDQAARQLTFSPPLVAARKPSASPAEPRPSATPAPQRPQLDLHRVLRRDSARDTTQDRQPPRKLPRLVAATPPRAPATPPRATAAPRSRSPASRPAPHRHASPPPPPPAPPKPAGIAALWQGRATSNAAATRSTRHRGMANLGNTCFVNAVLQLLLGCRSFVRDLAGAAEGAAALAGAGPSVLAAMRTCAAERVADEERATQEESSGGSGGSSLSQRGPVSSVSPNVVLRTIGQHSAGLFASNRQHDAHEFMVTLLDAMQQEALSREAARLGAPRVPVVSAACPVTTAFSLCIEHVMRCGACGHSGAVRESTTHVSIDVTDPEDPVSGPQSTANLLEAHFRRESLEKDCDGCGRKGVAHSVERRIVRMPRYLILHLKRFRVAFSPRSGAAHVAKAGEPVCARQRISIAACCAPDAAPPLGTQAAARAAAACSEPEKENLSPPRPVRTRPGSRASRRAQAEADAVLRTINGTPPGAEDADCARGRALTGPAGGTRSHSGSRSARTRTSARRGAGLAVECEATSPGPAGGVPGWVSAIAAPNDHNQGAERAGPGVPSGARVEVEENAPPGLPMGAGDAGYRLRGVVSHLGSDLHAGHFVADVRVAGGSAPAAWHRFNDSLVSRIPDEATVYAPSGDSYVLVYAAEALHE